MCPIRQWFPILVLENPNTAHLRCLPIQTHLIQLISSSVKTPRPQKCVSDKRDTKTMQCWGSPGPGLGNTAIRS